MAERSFVALPQRALLAVSGADRRAFLQGLVSNDVEKVSPSRTVHAALLTAQGKYLHDFFIIERGDAFLLEAEAARLADLQRRLSIYRLRAKVAIAPAEAGLAVAAAFGEGALAALGLREEAGAAAPFAGGLAYVDPRLAALGARLIVPPESGFAGLRAAGFAEAGAAAYDRMRIGLGVPDGSRDLAVEKAILLEAGFDELNGVDWQKGCYVGQELTARTKYRGLIKKRLMPVRVEGPLPEPGTPVRRGGEEVGEIRSGAGDTALALLRLEAIAEPGLEAGGARVTPQMPGWARF
ncbi:MAG TPA: folate-binding protein [Stellaceae bacterium]|nr:folate-binding protein [Stellaceae bacterium]